MEQNIVLKKKWQCLDTTALKLLAAALMFFDHVHQMFAAQGAPLWLTMLGRPVFPLFLFAAAEGFHYTRDRKKYLKRMLFCSWGMTVGTFLLQMAVPNREVVLMNNAFGTFFLSALYMQSWDWFYQGIREKRWKLVLRGILCCFIPVLTALPLFLLGGLTAKVILPLPLVRLLAMFALLLPNILAVEGGVAMIALGTAFYIFRKHRWAQVLVLLLLSVADYRISGGGIQWMMCFAAIPMLLYNGEKGRGWKNFFYFYYPAHIAVLYLMSAFFM